MRKSKVKGKDINDVTFHCGSCSFHNKIDLFMTELIWESQSQADDSSLESSV